MGGGYHWWDAAMPSAELPTISLVMKPPAWGSPMCHDAGPGLVLAVGARTGNRLLGFAGGHEAPDAAAAPLLLGKP